MITVLNKYRLHAMVTSLSWNHKNGDKMLQDVGLQKADGSGVKSEDSINVVHGPIGEGYAVSTPDELGKTPSEIKSSQTAYRKNDS